MNGKQSSSLGHRSRLKFALFAQWFRNGVLIPEFWLQAFKHHKQRNIQGGQVLGLSFT